jgi:recombination protein RecA
MITKFLRRNADSIRNNRVAFVFINQVRDNVGGYIKSFATPGGHALKHFSALRISLYPSEKIKQGNEIIGVNSKFTIAKNKMSSPFKTYYFPVIFGKGVDYFSDLVNFAMELGVIERKGAFYKFNGDTIGKGAIAVMDFLKLKESKPTLDKIEELVYNIVRNHNIVLEKLEEIVESEEKDE